MRDRLIDVLREPIPVIRGLKIFGESRMSAVDAERYADHLLANGVIVPPCKVGDNDAYVEEDVVEVVRCKDCDVPHNRWTGCPNLNGMIPPPDFYCARGERKQPTADVTDINVGNKTEWISHEGYEECGLCHRKAIYQHNFCPSCGAKMRKEDEGEMKIVYDDLFEFSEIAIRCNDTVRKGKCSYCPFFDRCQIDQPENRHIHCGGIDQQTMSEKGGAEQ